MIHANNGGSAAGTSLQASGFRKTGRSIIMEHAGPEPKGSRRNQAKD
jgi:hypothetical protein